MKQTITGTLEFDSCMSSDGDNVCFVVVYDKKRKQSLFDVAEMFDMKNVKITIEEVPSDTD